jgi:hypothetical protein
MRQLSQHAANCRNWSAQVWALLRNETLFTPPIGITERLFTVGKCTSQTALGAHHEQLCHRYIVGR